MPPDPSLRAGLEQIKRALDAAYTDTGHGCFGRGFTGEYVPSPFGVVADLLRAQPPDPVCVDHPTSDREHVCVTCVEESVEELLAGRAQPPPAPDPLLDARAAWEAGFNLAVSYGNNFIHFAGEQRERQWQAYLKRVAALPAVEGTRPPDTEDR